MVHRPEPEPLPSRVVVPAFRGWSVGEATEVESLTLALESEPYRGPEAPARETYTGAISMRSRLAQSTAVDASSARRAHTSDVSTL